MGVLVFGVERTRDEIYGPCPVRESLIIYLLTETVSFELLFCERSVGVETRKRRGFGSGDLREKKEVYK